MATVELTDIVLNYKSQKDLEKESWYAEQEYLDITFGKKGRYNLIARADGLLSFYDSEKPERDIEEVAMKDLLKKYSAPEPLSSESVGTTNTGVGFLGEDGPQTPSQGTPTAF